MTARGRILTSDALIRLQSTIIKKFSSRKFPRIYQGTSGSEYNFAELIKQTELSNGNHFPICSDTLRKIFRREKVDKSSLKALFDFFEEPFAEIDMLPPQEYASSQANNHDSLYRERTDLLQKPYCNLPRVPYTEFIGRSHELRNLLQYISLDYRAPIITIDGVGGLGKTALALEAAYLCWEAKHGQRKMNAPIFDAIIFVSAKEKNLSADGFVDSSLRHSTLNEIFRTIASTLNDESINRATLENQLIRVYESLNRQKTLLIVDDLQNMTLEEQNKIMSFLDNVPYSTKVLITTRRRRQSYSPIRLGCLSEEESYQLIRQKAEDKGITISDDDATRLYECFLGFPIAFIYAIGKLASGHSIDSIVCKPCPIRKEIAYFCFDNSIQVIRETPAHRLLMSVALFHNAPTRNALVAVAGLNLEPEYEVDSSLVELNQLSLVSVQEGRYVMLSVTRDYTLEELSRYPDFETDARERWILWYRNFAQENGGMADWGDWYITYDRLESEWENIWSVLRWCANHGRYEDVKLLWKDLNHFADLYGYWQDRLACLNWLLDKSRDFGDVETLVYALARKIWTLTMMGNYDGAEQLIAEAWELHACTDTILQDYLAHNTAVLYIRQKRYQDAHEVLDKKAALVADMNGIEERVIIRCTVNTMRDRAKIFLKQGRFDEAKAIYEKILDATERIGWNRLYCYTHNILANIAIEQCCWKKAQEHLDAGLPIAKRNRNKRRLAFYKFSSAKLERALGNTDLAWKLANEAKDDFNRLGMMREVEEISTLFVTPE
ncbi:tetratricopeptide repeat protein [Nostoc sp. 106C]|uniref:tetratricopeptide repeat protein n=1 Tax=Nostoc sp. 106C TaxID=1932667 RepID=UPI000A385676|nr:tetratricopeptide repeat protein [Nostoc sp. 106C]OUL31129.1 hypothetical protein BV375_13000 [Nostoc sp. 106C]